MDVYVRLWTHNENRHPQAISTTRIYIPLLKLNGFKVAYSVDIFGNQKKKNMIMCMRV